MLISWHSILSMERGCPCCWNIVFIVIFSSAIIQVRMEIFYPKLLLNSCSAFRVLGYSVIPYCWKFRHSIFPYSWGCSVILTVHRMGSPSENVSSTSSSFNVPPSFIENTYGGSSKIHKQWKGQTTTTGATSLFLCEKWVGSLTSPS